MSLMLRYLATVFVLAAVLGAPLKASAFSHVQPENRLWDKIRPEQADVGSEHDLSAELHLGKPNTGMTVASGYPVNPLNKVDPSGTVGMDLKPFDKFREYGQSKVADLILDQNISIRGYT